MIRWLQARKESQVGQREFLYNSKLRFMPKKLRSRWIGPFVVTNIFLFGTIKIKNEEINNVFKVNKHRLKHFYKGFQAQTMDEVALKDATYMS